MNNWTDYTNKRTSIKIHTFTYNLLILRNVSIFLDHPQGVLHQTSIYKTHVDYQQSKMLFLKKLWLSQYSITLSYSHYTHQFCTSTTNSIISTLFKDQNFNLFDHPFAVCIRLFDVRLPDNDLRSSKIDTCRSLFYVLLTVHLDIVV